MDAPPVLGKSALHPQQAAGSRAPILVMGSSADPASVTTGDTNDYGHPLVLDVNVTTHQDPAIGNFV